MRSFLLCVSAILAFACDGELVSPIYDLPEASAASPSDAASSEGPALRLATEQSAALFPQPRDGTLIYPTDRIHSPIDARVLTGWREIWNAHPERDEHALIKVGDSITVAPYFLNCLDSDAVMWGDHAALEETWTHFSSGAEGPELWSRESLSARGGRTAYWVTEGEPSPLSQELMALQPRYAVVMFGTNDMGWFAADVPRAAEWMMRHYVPMVNQIVAAGTLPILSTIPARHRYPVGHWVHAVNGLIRAVAQSKGIPLVDYHRAMSELPNEGLSSDGVHPNAFRSGGACDFTDAGLRYGYNVRNLITLQALDRIRRALRDGPLDSPASLWAGDGSFDSPFRGLSDGIAYAGDTRESSSRRWSMYTGCEATQDESGPEQIFTFELGAARRMRALVVSLTGDIDVHVLRAPSEASCWRRGHREVSALFSPGMYWWSLDTFVSAAGEQAGAYLFSLTPCDDDDDTCAL